jgi:hypothetical protein
MDLKKDTLVFQAVRDGLSQQAAGRAAATDPTLTIMALPTLAGLGQIPPRPSRGISQ